VKANTEALFYVQCADKVDLPGAMTYQHSFVPMWVQALSYALPEKVTPQETKWNENVKGLEREFRAIRAGCPGTFP